MLGGPLRCEHTLRDSAKPWLEDVYLISEERGYDILPFLTALHAIKSIEGTPRLGGHMTKLHSKTDLAWRDALFQSTYVVPQELFDLVASRSCLSHLSAQPRDANAALWSRLHRARAAVL